MNVIFEDEKEYMSYVKYDNSTKLRQSFSKITDNTIIVRLFGMSLKLLRHFSFKTLYISYPYLSPKNPIKTIVMTLIRNKNKGDNYIHMLDSMTEIVKFLMEFQLLDIENDIVIAYRIAQRSKYHDMDDMFKIILGCY